MPPLKAVIFDLDNTLTDFMRMKHEAVRSAMEAMVEAGLDYKVDRGLQDILTIYDEKGYEFQEVFNDFLTVVTGAVNYKFLAAGIVAYRRARDSSLVLYPHVNVTLMTLAKEGYRLGVVSDAPSREAWMRRCYLNLHPMFDAVVTFDDTGVHKPAPEPFRAICKLLDVKPEEALMVGDWPERDLKGAAQVGMRTAFARYGNSHGVTSSEADFTLDNIDALINIVRGFKQ
ncbi:MAG: HAD-IA family hydrolase [Candidatus Marinimicrobia bacterium]|nr:HAD-IA family hydrolase [Candidatus Neomarinimicrobiota bacterium]